MKTNNKKIRAVFGPETRFEIIPVNSPPFWTFETGLERLKSELLSEQLNALQDEQLNSCIRRAANEAAELALGTCYPLLLFPALFQERIDKIVSFEDRTYAGQVGLELLEV
jgi:hypothetical protein